MGWNILNKARFNNSPGTVSIVFFVLLICATIVVLPAGAVNTTQTISPTLTTAPATSVVTTTIPATTQTTSQVTSSSTTSISTTQTTIPPTSHTTTVATTATQPVVNPVVAFSADTTEGPAPLTVTFADMSTGGPVSWSWEFGDGTSDTSQNPSHTYNEPGTYTVRMTATTRTGSGSANRIDYIVVEQASVTATTTTTTTTTTSTSTVTTNVTPTSAASANNLLAAFDGSPRSGKSPLTVVFTDTTVGSPVSWLWDFGDGTTDTSQDPTHTYNEPGTYTVVMTVNSSSAGKTIKHVNFITVKSLSDSAQPEETSSGSMSNDYQVRTKVSSAAGSGSGSGQVSSGQAKTPTPTLTGKAWLEYEKQRMAEVDAIAANQSGKDIISQVFDFFKGLFTWIK